MVPANKRLLILTGDHSADGHAATIARALKEIDPQWQVSGVGGAAMKEAGVELLADHEGMGIIGPGLVAGIPSHLRLAKKILAWVDEHKPAVAVTIDYGVFHMWLAPKLRKRGVKVLYFIPPQIWASRPWRLRKLRRAADEVLCILPFEQEYYRTKDIPATFVGNPLVNQLPSPVSKEEFCARHGMDAKKQLIGLFPGSRRFEIRHLLDVQIAAARKLEELQPGRFEFALARAKNLKDEFFEPALAAARGDALVGLKVLREQNHPLLSACDIALLASGTVTLEAALYQTPMVVMYRGPTYLYYVAKMLMTVSDIALPNVLSGRRIVPELWQHAATPEKIAQTALAELEQMRLAQVKADLTAVSRQFATRDTPQRVAQAIVRLASGV